MTFPANDIYFSTAVGPVVRPQDTDAFALQP